MAYHHHHHHATLALVAALSVSIISMVCADKPVMPVAVSHNLNAQESPEAYWNSVLPNTTIPRAILNVLHPGKGEEVAPDLVRRRYNQRRYTRVSYRSHYTQSGLGDGDEVPNLHGGPGTRVRRRYVKRSDKDETLVNPPSAPWFLEKDLYPGKQMEMEIARPESDSYTFVPRQVAESFPFSSDKFPAILTKLSINPESPKAEQMKNVIKECELPAEEGEVKTCATSLESMIDFSIQRLGKHIQAVSTEAEKDTKLQKFTILKGIKQIGDDEAVACHKQDYAYAVFYCHDVKGARAYVVPFQGTSGSKVSAVGICHTNTTGWSPDHVSFQILKVKPGGEPICHFLPEYNVLWARK